MTDDLIGSQKRNSNSARTRWVTVALGLAIAALIIGSLYYFIFISTQSEPPLSLVDGGVEWILDDLDDRLYRNWSSSHEFNGTTVVTSYAFVVFYAGESYSSPNVYWRLSSEPLLTGSNSVCDFGIYDIGGASLRLIVTDTLGDGMVGRNDSIALMLCNSTSFLPDRVYSIEFGIGSSMGGAWTTVSFKLHNGHLVSWVSEEYRAQWM